MKKKVNPIILLCLIKFPNKCVNTKRKYLQEVEWDLPLRLRCQVLAVVPARC